MNSNDMEALAAIVETFDVRVEVAMYGFRIEMVRRDPLRRIRRVITYHDAFGVKEPLRLFKLCMEDMKNALDPQRRTQAPHQEGHHASQEKSVVGDRQRGAEEDRG